MYFLKKRMKINVFSSWDKKLSLENIDKVYIYIILGERVGSTKLSPLSLAK